MAESEIVITEVPLESMMIESCDLRSSYYTKAEGVKQYMKEAPEIKPVAHNTIDMPIAECKSVPSNTVTSDNALNEIKTEPPVSETSEALKEIKVNAIDHELFNLETPGLEPDDAVKEEATQEIDHVTITAEEDPPITSKIEFVQVDVETNHIDNSEPKLKQVIKFVDQEYGITSIMLPDMESNSIIVESNKMALSNTDNSTESVSSAEASASDSIKITDILS